MWIGRWGLGRDITQYGDHNPGATNVLKAGDRTPKHISFYALALFMDVAKAALPIGLAHYVFGWTDWWMVLIALAPLLGHAYSPFLGWKGGKSAATALGMWIGLTLWTIPLVAVISIVIWSFIIKPSGYAILLTLLTIAIALFLLELNYIYWLTWLGQSIILLIRYRQDLKKTPEFIFRT